MDFVAYIHRYTAEQYIKRAIKVLEENKENEEIKAVIQKIITPSDLWKFDFNKHDYKQVEHYF